MALSDGERQLREDTSIAFLNLVAITLGTLDHTTKERVTIDEFMETLDTALKMRLTKPDGELLASRLPRLRDWFERRARRCRYEFGMMRSIDEVFDELELDTD